MPSSFLNTSSTAQRTLHAASCGAQQTRSLRVASGSLDAACLALADREPGLGLVVTPAGHAVDVVRFDEPVPYRLIDVPDPRPTAPRLRLVRGALDWDDARLDRRGQQPVMTGVVA